jgi:hypothetical protein
MGLFGPQPLSWQELRRKDTDIAHSGPVEDQANVRRALTPGVVPTSRNVQLLAHATHRELPHVVGYELEPFCFGCAKMATAFLECRASGARPLPHDPTPGSVPARASYRPSPAQRTQSHSHIAYANDTGCPCYFILPFQAPNVALPALIQLHQFTLERFVVRFWFLGHLPPSLRVYYIALATVHFFRGRSLLPLAGRSHHSAAL